MNPDISRFTDFLAFLRSSVTDRCIEQGGADGGAGSPFREEAFTGVVLEMLEDLGHVRDPQLCYFDRKLGRAQGRLNAWSADEDEDEVDLITTIYRGVDAPGNVPASEVTQSARRAIHVFWEARSGFHRDMEPASCAFDLGQRLHEIWPDVKRLRVIILVDGLAGAFESKKYEIPGIDLLVDVWDLRRLSRATLSGLTYEPVEIDIASHLGGPLICLSMPESSADYRSYVAVVPGSLLHSLYHEFGSRLLELNVRSFLQARGKVNRGIRDTLKSEPARFLAYNNGISATAEAVEAVSLGARTVGITKIRGLQIVNGGQTVASIHRAAERDKVGLDDVFVQAKLTVVRPEHVESLVPMVSRYANTQNRVNEADFSANHRFHTRLQQLSEVTWSPGEQSRWFYERARGQYQVAKARAGSTLAQRRRFESATPPGQRFDKVQLARYLNTWDQLPHIVSRGGQKNFVAFMERVSRNGDDWEPDPAFYRQLIAKTIIVKRAEKVARTHGFPGYRANAVAYTVALLAYRTAGRLDLEQVWNNQEPSPAVADTLHEWMPQVYEQILRSAGARNVTEWCKKDECWRQMQLLGVSLLPELETEIADGQPLPTVGDAGGKDLANLSSADRENIARVMQISSERWIEIAGWGSRTGLLKDWQVGIATTLAGYAATGWTKVPSRKQALHALELIRTADSGLGREEP